MFQLAAFAGPPYEKFEHRSELLDSTETYLVAVPSGYADPENAERRYPVIYGIQSTGSEFSKLLEMMKREMIPPMILVGSDVDGGENAWSDRGRPTESYFIKELVPLIDETYRTVTDAPGRVLFGNSKGGSGCLRLMLNHPEMFYASVSLDGAMQLYDEGYEEDGESFAQLVERGGADVIHHPVLLIGGGWFGDRAAKYAPLLREAGMRDVTLLQSPGCGHNGACLIETNMAAIAAAFCNGLLGETPVPAPTIIMGKYIASEFRTAEPVSVTFRVPVHRAGLDAEPEIFYTLDGTPPTPESQRYEGAFEITESATIRAMAVGGPKVGVEGRSRESFAKVEILPMRAAVEVEAAGLEPGLVLEWFEYGVSAERAAEPGVDPAENRKVAGLPLREEGVPDKRIFRLRGYLRVPATGIYRFDLGDDKVLLAVGEDAPPAASSGQYVALEEGLYPIAIYRPTQKGRAEIRGTLRWTPPDGESGKVPAEAVLREVK